MGIPHLITCLRPFARPADLAGQNIVIDGPGLAYHIWHLCLASRSEFRNPFEAAPSYVIIQETVLEWLDELRKNDNSLKKIFFDGALPASKRDTRFARVRGYTKQLNEYHQAWPQIIPYLSFPGQARQPMVKLFHFESVQSNFIKLPAAPFLVPAVIESLSRCDRFKDLLEVVPGEADTYCAHYLRNHGGIVLTGDSDLLVHDLGTGSVIFFRDIEPMEFGYATSLRCPFYDMDGISTRLELPKAYGIRSLAFEMIMDPHGSFRELKQRAGKIEAISSHKKVYQDFASEYAASTSNLNLEHKHDTHNKPDFSILRSNLKILDPRISEFVLQFPVFAQVAGLSNHSRPYSFDGQNKAEIFLPFLLDSPIRTSAWEMSVRVRLLAYGLLNFVIPASEQITSVFEHRRLQTGTQGREWQVPSSERLIEACLELTNLFRQLYDASLKPTDPTLWRAAAVYQDLAYSLDADKPALYPSLIAQLKNVTTAQKRLTWDGIHFYAQLQGSYYSFRILKQILAIVLHCEGTKALPSVLHHLQANLEDLPTLSSLPSVGDAIKSFGTPEDQDILAIVRKLIGFQDDEVVVKRNEKKTKRRSRKANKEQKSSQERQNNAFEILAKDLN